MTTSLPSRCLVLQSTMPRQVFRILQLLALGVLALMSRSRQTSLLGLISLTLLLLGVNNRYVIC